MKKIELDAEDLAFVEELRAGLAADDGTEYGWIVELPEDPGVPSSGQEVVAEVRAVAPRTVRRTK